MENLEFMSKQLKAVSDPNRLKLLACLKKGEVCACDFVDVLHISQPAVSQHLKKLKDAAIIYIQAIIDQLEMITVIKCSSC